jgi:hypothetical protein
MREKTVGDLAGAVKIRTYLNIALRFLPPVDTSEATDSPWFLRSSRSLKALASESDDFVASRAFGFFFPRVPFGSVPFTIFRESDTF